MICIIDSTTKITIEGHAGAAPHGESVPCEAVTVLVNTIAQSLVHITEQPEQILNFASGCFILSKEGLSTESGLLVSSFLLGLEMVSQAYPQYISMTKL